MNLLTILMSRIGLLPTGDYTRGLESVVTHIEVAVGHLQRGQASGEETAFTDAIYRTNQAYEGSLKEAYRVLAKKDPTGKTPFSIEEYLQKENTLRPRVLAQLTNYRQDWRNPSTHDHKIDFDEDEALLAIVSVCAFAIVLTDQIIERSAFERAADMVRAKGPIIDTSQPLLERVASLLVQYPARLAEAHQADAGDSESSLLGAIAGFIEASCPGVLAEVNVSLGKAFGPVVDVLVNEGKERLVLDVKHWKKPHKLDLQALTYLRNYMDAAETKAGIFYIHPYTEGTLFRRDIEVSSLQGRIVVIGPDSHNYRVVSQTPLAL